MQKFIYVLLAIMGAALFSSTTFAKNNDAQVAMPQPLPVGNATAICDNMPTCLNIYNYSSFPIGIQVPILNFSRTLYPDYMQAVQALDYNYKRVILSDWLGLIFYDAYLPPHYDLYVYDYNGKMTVKFNK